jgi:hypothetical protein
LKYRNEAGPTCQSQQPIKTLATGYRSPIRARVIAAGHVPEARAPPAIGSTPALTAPTCLAVPIHCCPWAVIEAYPCFASSLPAHPPQLSSMPPLPPRSASTQIGTSGHGIASLSPPRAPPWPGAPRRPCKIRPRPLLWPLTGEPPPPTVPPWGALL